jgi:putative copper export protein
MIALEAIASALSYIALAAMFGHLVAAGFLLPDGEPKALRGALVNRATAALLVFLAAALAALLIQGEKIQHGVPSTELLARYLTLTQSGKVWLARQSYGAILALMLRARARKVTSVNTIRGLTVLAAPLVASRSLTSHAVAVREDIGWAVGADALHLICTALWAGGLLALWHALSRASEPLNQPLAWTEAIVARFSRLAFVSVTLLAISGLYQGWIHVGTLAILLHTDYGRVLLLKLLLFAAMLGCGALNLFSTRRLLARAVARNENDFGATTTSLRRVRIESVIGLVIFCMTGLLTVLPPGVHAVHQAAAATPATADAVATKSYLPAQGARVRILRPKAGEFFISDHVPLRFALVKGQRGHHVHAYVDGELMGMFQSETGTLNGLKPGRHRLELRVVAEDHQTELDAFDRVEFTVN